MNRALVFYTEVLDFQIAAGDDPGAPVLDLVRDGAKLQLSTFDGTQAIAVNVDVDEVDNLFRKYLERGLDISAKANSPVHRGPLDQTWGTREFYVTDPDGNTLRFRQIPE